MIFRTLFKWARRLAISLVTDPFWRCPGFRPSWKGSRSGGAYVDLRRLKPESVVYSFGIATEISFDRAVIEATGCQVFGFDPDPRCRQWLEEPGRWVPPQFHFAEVALGASSGKVPFHITDLERMTGSLTREYSDGETVQVKCQTLRDIMAILGHKSVDYLKLDIEGAEYDVLESWLREYETLPVRQLWVEFHSDGEKWTEGSSKRLLKRLAKIGMESGYRDYFRCPNNYLMINTRMTGHEEV